MEEIKKSVKEKKLKITPKLIDEIVEDVIKRQVK